MDNESGAASSPGVHHVPAVVNDLLGTVAGVSLSSTTTAELVADSRRTIVLEGAHNVRDLGGYQIADGRAIAWRRLLRADGLHGLTTADLAQLAPLRLRTVIDLRREDEIADRGAFPVERLPVDLVHLPVMDSTWMSLAIPDFSTH